jgi:hypothetical protein
MPAFRGATETAMVRTLVGNREFMRALTAEERNGLHVRRLILRAAQDDTEAWMTGVDAA